MREAAIICYTGTLLLSCSSPAVGPDLALDPGSRISASTDGQIVSSTPPLAGPRQPGAPVDVLPLPRLGLRRLDFDDPVTGAGSGHMAQLSVAGDLVFAANSFSGITTYLANDDGTLDLMSLGSTPSLRCTTIASHEPTQTVFCAAPDPIDFGPSGRVYAIDVSDPRAPHVRPAGEFTTEAGPIGDLALSGTWLYAAAGAGGLLRAEVDRTGRLGAWRSIYSGDTFAVDANGDHIVILDRDRGLVVLNATDATEFGVAPLAGPMLSVHLRGDQVAVSLGSEGVRVFDSSSGSISPTADVRPRCVADAADLEGSLLAVGCLTGTYLYDLSASPARLAGFEPAEGGVRDLRFAWGGLVVTDFSRINRLAVDGAGAPLLVDATWNAPYDSDGVAQVGIRNEGQADVLLEVLLRTEESRAAEPWRRLRIPAGGELRVPFEAAALRPLVGDSAPVVRVQLRPVAISRLREAGMLAPAQRRATEVRLLRRTEGVTAPTLPGERFPHLGLSDDRGTPVTVASAPTRLVLYQGDCALMWPELTELAWQKRHGDAAHPVTLVAPYIDPRVVAYLRLEVFAPLQIGDGEVLWPDGTSQRLGYSLYERFLSFGGSRNGAHWPTDQIIGADGRLVRIERAYRGRHPL